MSGVLVACEFSGVVREAFRRRGHDAWSCDLLPAEDGSPFHYQRNMWDVIGQPWELVIAHPPCTYLANSGVRWLHEQPGRWAKMVSAANEFRMLLEISHVPRVCVENPIMHGYAAEVIGRRQDQVIQPWMFGHGEVKATCLYLRNLPPLVPTEIVDGRRPRVHHEPPSPDRWKNRSRTYPGIGEAMAAQWGALLLEKAA